MKMPITPNPIIFQWDGSPSESTRVSRTPRRNLSIPVKFLKVKISQFSGCFVRQRELTFPKIRPQVVGSSSVKRLTRTKTRNET